MTRLLIIAAALSLSTAAVAQTEGRERRVVYDMDADVITGNPLDVPDVPVVRTQPKHTHKNLIRLRASFAPELLASASKI